MLTPSKSRSVLPVREPRVSSARKSLGSATSNNGGNNTTSPAPSRRKSLGGDDDTEPATPAPEPALRQRRLSLSSDNGAEADTESAPTAQQQASPVTQHKNSVQLSAGTRSTSLVAVTAVAVCVGAAALAFATSEPPSSCSSPESTHPVEGITNTTADCKPSGTYLRVDWSEMCGTVVNALPHALAPSASACEASALQSMSADVHVPFEASTVYACAVVAAFLLVALSILRRTSSPQWSQQCVMHTTPRDPLTWQSHLSQYGAIHLYPITDAS